VQDFVAAELANTHPEVVRLASMPEHETDVGHRLAVDYLRMFLRMLYRACADEGLDMRVTTRIVNRTVYGDPDGPPPSRDAQTQIKHLPQVSREQLLGLREGSGRQLRTPGDGLGPLTPTDYVVDRIPVRVDTGDPNLDQKILGALQPLTDPARQEAWLLEGGEERAAAGPPPGVQRHNSLPTDPTQQVRGTEAFGGGYSWTCSCGARSKRYAVIRTAEQAVRRAREHHRKQHPGIVQQDVPVYDRREEVSGEADPER
jgi:hypothetical protein